jgi:ZIP family zinc transporter
MNVYPVLFGIVTFFSISLGGFFAVRYRDNFGVLAAFAAGVLISVPLFDLLPETFNLAIETGVPIENLMYLAALGFIFLYVLERYLSVHRVCESEVCKNIRHPIGGVLGAAELSAHSFMDGFAIGLVFEFSFDVGIIVTVAVICHDFADGLNTVTIMLNSGNSLSSSMRMLLPDSSTQVVGAVSTLFKVPVQYLVFILPFFAGGFLYLGASDLLPEAHERNPPLVSLLSSLAGFLFIFILTKTLNI